MAKNADSPLTPYETIYRTIGEKSYIVSKDS